MLRRVWRQNTVRNQTFTYIHLETMIVSNSEAASRLWLDRAISWLREYSGLGIWLNRGGRMKVNRVKVISWLRAGV